MNFPVSLRNPTDPVRGHPLQRRQFDRLRTPGEITLYCDSKRVLPQTDPLSRQIMLSHDKFLELLNLTARECGLRADIALFPQGAFCTGKLGYTPGRHGAPDPRCRGAK